MTLAELAEILARMPESAETARVSVRGYDVDDVVYERGVVFVKTNQPRSLDDDDDDEF